ncbi:MAG: MATE family efflux transporter [Bacteroidales bacterium]
MNDLTQGKEGRQIFYFALPMLLGNVFQQLYNIIDSAIVGNFIGKEALAAVGASFPVVFAFFSLIIGISSGSTVMISQFYGAGQMEKVRKTIDTLFVFLLFASIVVSVLGLIFARDVFVLLQLPENVLPEATVYLRIFLGGVVVFFGFSGTSAVLRGLGDSKTPLYFLIIATVFNIGFDLLFVLVFHWGIAGVAIATLLAQGGAFLSAVIYLNRTHDIIHFAKREWEFDWLIFRQSLRIGIPTGIQQTFVSLGMMALVGIVNTFGTNAIAAYSVTMRINSLASLPAMNFASALSTFVGQNIGAHKPDRVRRGLLATLKMSALVAALVSLGVILFSKEIMSVFTKDQAVIQVGIGYLKIVGAFYLVFSLMFSITGLLRGAGATVVPMFTTLLSLWVVRIPLAWYLSGKIGITGIWWAIPLGWFVGLVLAFLYYFSGRWKNKSVV